MGMFCNIIHVYIVTFDQLGASLLNKSCFKNIFFNINKEIIIIKYKYIKIIGFLFYFEW